MLYDGHSYITWCIDFHNYYIFIVDLPYLVQYGIFDVEKAFKVLCGQILSILSFMVSVFCAILNEAISTYSF